jgi:hypothetical protein
MNRLPLIEGHNTHPVDIERAMKNDYSGDPEQRNLQLEAKAHVAVQRWVDEGGVKGRVATVGALCEIHRRFSEQLPKELLMVSDPDSGRTVNDPADSWARAAVLLRDAGRLADEDARRLRWLDAFGALIGNTDRHQNNIVFLAEGSGLRLEPAFDQVSMLYAPSEDGQVPSRIFASPHPTADTVDLWDDARMAAREFWQRASDDGRLSDDLQCVCAANAKKALVN